MESEILDIAASYVECVNCGETYSLWADDICPYCGNKFEDNED